LLVETQSNAPPAKLQESSNIFAKSRSNRKRGIRDRDNSLNQDFINANKEEIVKAEQRAEVNELESRIKDLNDQLALKDSEHEKSLEESQKHFSTKESSYKQ
jgi:hypothetical protein